jgi:hypothetical protein
MALTNVGRDLIAAALVGDSYVAYDAANAHIGVGDGVDVFAPADTDLSGTMKLRKAMEAAYPTRAVNVLTFRSLFLTTEANFAWNEWGVFNAAAAGEMLNRKVESLGTKTSTQSWQLTVQLTVEAA